MATVVITGAGGLVGGHLRTALEARGDIVRGLSLRSGRADPAVLDGADAVVHLAGEPVAGRWTTAKREAILSSRREGTRRLVDAIGRAEQAPRVLVAASAIGFYGDRGDELLTEQSAGGAGFLRDVCTAWEEEAERATGLGLRVVRTRFGIILARNAMAFRLLALPARCGVLGPMGSGRQWWSWIHIADVTGLIARALEDERYSGVINATAPEAMPQREIARTFGRVLHRPSFVPAPAFALRLLLGGFSIELLASRRVAPERAAALGYSFEHPGVEGALRDLLG